MRCARLFFPFALAFSAALPLSGRAASSTSSARAGAEPRGAAFDVPGLDPSALAAGLAAFAREDRAGEVGRRLLTIIDYSLPSTQKRLWVLDPANGKVLFHELVAHGKGTGELRARDFGNALDSHRTSLGTFLTGETYRGKHGYSLKLDGLDAGVNDNARVREIVIHGASYATPEFARRYGRLGRSFGCPALDPRRTRAVIDAIKGGSVVFAWGGRSAPAKNIARTAESAPP